MSTTWITWCTILVTTVCVCRTRYKKRKFHLPLHVFKFCVTVSTTRTLPWLVLSSCWEWKMIVIRRKLWELLGENANFERKCYEVLVQHLSSSSLGGLSMWFFPKCFLLSLSYSGEASAFYFSSYRSLRVSTSYWYMQVSTSLRVAI